MSVIAEGQALREALITDLRGLDAVRTEAVAQAFRVVPRHAFVPEESLGKAYEAEHAVVTKRDDAGTALSSISAARIQAFMLEQAHIEPGMRVLEIGSGGYNAALISELVGPRGEVTTIDIDPDVIDRAHRALSVTGYGHVRALVGDGADGLPEHAPYDRIIVTVEAADLAPAWIAQLTESGRIVVPLRLRGLTRSVAFTRADRRLLADDYQMCGFVPMRGSHADRVRLVVLRDAEDEQVGLRVDDRPDVDPALLRAAWEGPRVEAWSGVTMSRGLPYDDLELWLATSLPEYGLLAATREARDRGFVASWSATGVSTALDGATGSFAYLAIRPVNAERTMFEFGAAAHGPRARDTADQMAEQLRLWDRAYRGTRAQLLAQPAADAHDIDGSASAARIIERPHYRFTISWQAR